MRCVTVGGGVNGRVSVCGGCEWGGVSGKCEIEFNTSFSVLGKIFGRTLIVKSCLSWGKNGLCVLGARGLNIIISRKWQNTF